MKTIYLHIGAPKTGTSALQNFFQKNRKILKKKEILYSQTGITRTSGQAELAFQVLELFPERNIDESIWNNLELEINKFNGEKILLDSEWFWNFNQQHIQALVNHLKAYNIKIIVYLRRQDEWVSSIVLQGTKLFERTWTSVDDHINALLENNNTNYYNKISNWEKVIGKENIIVREYNRKKLYNNDIYHDFLKNVFNMECDDTFITTSEDINPRLDAKASKYKFIVNKLPLSKREKDSLLPFLFDYSRTQNSGKDILISNKKRKQIIEKYSESNARLCMEYNVDSYDLFEENKYLEVDVDKEYAYENIACEDAINISKYLLSTRYKELSETQIAKVLVNLIIKASMNEYYNKPYLELKEEYYTRNKDIKKQFDTSEILYKCPLDFIGEKKHPSIENMSVVKNALVFDTAEGFRSHFYLLKLPLHLHNRKLILIKIDILVQNECNLKLQYKTESKNFSPFSVINRTLNSGRNELFVFINDEDNIKQIRLYPSNVKNKVKIYDIEVRG